MLYVDDLFITGAERPIPVCKGDLASEYEMTDIGLMHYFLGLEVWQDPSHSCDRESMQLIFLGYFGWRIGG